MTVDSKSISPEPNAKKRADLISSDASIKKNNSLAKLGKKALMRKLMMKNANTKLDYIQAKYNYTGNRKGRSSTITADKPSRSGNATFIH